MTTTLRRPPPAPPVWATPPRRLARPALLLTGLALVAGVAAVGGVVAVGQLVQPPAPQQVSVGESVALPGVEFTVTQFERRRDAVTGTGTAQQPMSGPAMPMGAGPSSGGAHDMASMPGMAGVLEPGQERLDVSVVVRGSGDRPTSLDPDRFRLYSAGRPVELLRSTVTTLTGTPLSRGTGMRGGVVLVVPAGTTPLELAYGDEPTRVVLGDAAGARAVDAGHDGAAHEVAR